MRGIQREKGFLNFFTYGLKSVWECPLLVVYVNVVRVKDGITSLWAYVSSDVWTSIRVEDGEIWVEDGKIWVEYTYDVYIDFQKMHAYKLHK